MRGSLGHRAIETMHHESDVWLALPTVAMALGFAVAWYFYIADPHPVRTRAPAAGAYQFLLNAWYFDALYDSLFVRPTKRLGRFLWKTGDGTMIDGIGPDGVSARVIDITNRVVKLQSGYIYHYAFAMLIGVAASSPISCSRRGAAELAGRSSPSHLPAAARRAPDRLLPAEDESFPQRALHRAVDHAHHLRAVAHPVWRLRSDHGAVPVRRAQALAPAPSATTWASTASPCRSCC